MGHSITVSLFEIKIKQLLSCASIDSILFSTDDQDLLNRVEKFKTEKIIIDYRPEKTPQTILAPVN